MRIMNPTPAKPVDLTSARHDCGFSLIEVLVALVVLSVGLLGLAALQSTAAQFNASAYSASQATILAYDMADRIRANRQAALTGAYTSPYPAMLPACDPGVALAGTVAVQDLAAWRRALACSLPSGTGEVDCALPCNPLGGGVVTIRVSWDETRRGGGAGIEQFEMTTGL
jgi:type IV pilus assembly protein PilV